MIADSKPTYSIVVPCYNEAASLAEVVGEFVSTLNDGGIDGQYEIILVNDGSTDDSTHVLRELSEIHPHLVVIHCDQNGGMWMAIHKGMQQVRGEFASFLPADGEIGAAQFLKLAKLAEGHDLVVSDRKAIDSETQKLVRPWKRSFLTWGHRTLIRTFLGLDVRGAEGIFLVRWSVFGDWAAAPRTDNVLFLELLARGLKGNYRVARTTIVYENRRAGTSKTVNPSYILGTLVDIAKLRWRMAGG